MKNILILLALSIAFLSACSSVKEQNQQNKNFVNKENTAGEDFITRSVSKEEYKELFKRYEDNDTTLTLSDYNALYYGQADQDGFSAYKRVSSAQRKKLDDILKDKDPGKEDWANALVVGKEIADDMPFDLNNIFMCFVASKRSGQVDESNKWIYKYNNIIEVIMRSGDGMTAKTAMKVMSTGAEYAILQILDLKFTSQALVFEEEKPFDVMSVQENEYGIEKVYFDISSFFGKF